MFFNLEFLKNFDIFEKIWDFFEKSRNMEK